MMAASTPLLTPKQHSLFKSQGFIEVNLLEVFPAVPVERYEALALAICAHGNKMIAERGGPSDSFSPTKPVTESHYNVAVRNKDAAWRDKDAMFKDTPSSRANTRNPLVSKQDGMGSLTTVYDLEGQLEMQIMMAPLLQELYRVFNCPKITELEASTLIMNRERIGIKFGPKDMPCHVDMAFVKSKIDRPLTHLLNPADPQSYKAGQRLQCAITLNDSAGGWYGYGFTSGVPCEQLLGNITGWPTPTTSPLRVDEYILQTNGLKRSTIGAKKAHAIIWSCAVAHGNTGVPKTSPPRLVLYVNYGLRPVVEGEADLVRIAKDIVGLGNHNNTNTKKIRRIFKSPEEEEEEEEEEGSAEGTPTTKKGKWGVMV